VMRKRIASLISNILNPFLVSLAVILLLSFRSASSTLDAIKWSLILVAISILPIFSVVTYLVRNGKLNGISINARKQRTKIYLLAGICAGAGCVILPLLEAPLILVATFVAGLSAIIVFTVINLLWKISLHTAFVAGSITALVIVYGSIAAVTVGLLPLIAWARTELEHHSLAQVATGAFLAALIVVLVYYPFGLV